MKLLVCEIEEESTPVGFDQNSIMRSTQFQRAADVCSNKDLELSRVIMLWTGECLEKRRWGMKKYSNKTDRRTERI